MTTDPAPVPAFHAWLCTCGVDVSRYRNWWIEIRLKAESSDGTQLDVLVDSQRWWFRFMFAGELVEIRHEVSDPTELGMLLDSLERRYEIRFRRSLPEIRSNVPSATSRVRQWLSIV